MKLELPPHLVKLRRMMIRRNMSQVDLARRIGYASSNVNRFLRGKSVITPDTAILLERVLRVSAVNLLRDQAAFQLDKLKREKFSHLYV